MTLAFVLNLDAELELARPVHYQRQRTIEDRIRVLALAMRPTLPEGAAVLDPLGETAEAGSVPVPWCPTPSALRAIAAARLVVPAAPDVSVLARVNARPFAFALSDGELAGAVLVHDLEVAERALARPGPWLLKRSFGVAGRGQRPVRGGETSDADRAFIAASLRDDGALVIEPRVAITRELSVHAWRTDRTHVRSIREQIVRDAAFVSSAIALGLDPRLERALIDATERVGAALGDAGYFGPFGVDAFEHEGGLRTLSEINARYCMGWEATDGWLPPLGSDRQLPRPASSR